MKSTLLNRRVSSFVPVALCIYVWMSFDIKYLAPRNVRDRTCVMKYVYIIGGNGIDLGANFHVDLALRLIARSSCNIIAAKRVCL